MDDVNHGIRISIPRRRRTCSSANLQRAGRNHLDDEGIYCAIAVGFVGQTCQCCEGDLLLSIFSATGDVADGGEGGLAVVLLIQHRNGNTRTGGRIARHISSCNAQRERIRQRFVIGGGNLCHSTCRGQR